MIQNTQDLNNALIMMVDDEPITMDVVQTFLEEFGYNQFIQISDSPSALEAIEKHSPDILLLDLVMPGKSGMEILAEVRDHKQLKHLPVIVLTASSDAQHKLQALELGATDFLAKPVDQSELGLRVRNTLAAKAYMDQLVFYDPITGLPNKNLFELKFDWALKKAQRNQENIALINITLDNFSRINSTLGLAASDKILHSLAARLQNLVREIDTLASLAENQRGSLGLYRVEGSSFTLLLDHPKTPESSAIVSRRILAAVSEPLMIDSTEIVVTASIGIATFPEEGDDSDILRQLAISARDFSASAGGNRFQFSSKTINTSLKKQLIMESHLRRAIDNDELFLYYQPKILIESGEIEGVEALLRWVDKDLGFVSPGEFIPIAEKTKLIVPIGEWVLLEACKTLVAWRKQGKKPVIMAINISSVQMEDPDFVTMVKKILATTNVDPKFIKLEITESLLLDDIDKKIELLNSLRQLGVQLSIDDFGTGYSSLSYLAKLPVSELKIDRSFVLDVESSEDSRALVSSIIYMAHSLGLSTVAEGIETQGQLDFVSQNKCDQYQGFFFSKPLPAEVIIEKLV